MELVKQWICELIKGELDMKPQIIEDFSALEESAYKSQYFRKALEGTEYVLCLVSAAEYLGLCNWTTEPMIYVFSKEDCLREGIAIASKKGLWYTTVNQTINDLLSDPEVDEQVILESLADQYYQDQYASLTIRPENQDAFQHFRPMAEHYYRTD